MNRLFPAALSVLSLTAAVNLSVLKAQTKARPEFEVASVKPHPLSISGITHRPGLPGFQCPPGENCGILGHRFREAAVNLATLIIDAYHVKRFQIVGLPSWGDSVNEAYDVEAEIPGEGVPAVDDVRLMLQTLLADRFQLRIHHESRVRPVYSLVAAKSGIKLVRDAAPCLGMAREGDPSKGSRRRDDAPFPWAFFAEQLSTYAHQPVVDETGLDGSGYCTADGKSPILALGLAMQSGGSVFAAVEEQWGMKLESKTASVDVVVIEKVERPSEN